MVPVMSSGKAAPPAAALDGLSEVIAGSGRFVVGAVMEKLTDFDVAAELETVTVTVP